MGEGGFSGLAEGEAGFGEFGFVGLDDSAGVVEVVVGASEFGGVGGEAVDSVVFGGAGDFVREVAEFDDEGFFSVVGEEGEVHVVARFAVVMRLRHVLCFAVAFGFV